MLEILKRLFSGKGPEASDGLNQPQREGIVELLLLAMYADNKLELNEENVLRREIQSFDWHSGVYLDGFVSEATARVRLVRINDEQRQHFLLRVGKKLADREVKERALRLCVELFRADGSQSDAEERFELEIRQAFGL